MLALRSGGHEEEPSPPLYEAIEIALEEHDKEEEEAQAVGRRFVRSVQRLWTKNFAVDENGETKPWRSKDPVPTAMFRVEVTDRRWIEHIEVGDSWSVFT